MTADAGAPASSSPWSPLRRPLFRGLWIASLASNTGAVSWGLWVDASDPGRHVESFVDESWVEHLRHHQRVTAVDRDVEAEARAFHLGPEPVAVSHFLTGGRE